MGECTVTQQRSVRQAERRRHHANLETKEPRHGQHAHILECLSLRLRAQALVNNALRVQLDGVLIKAKALLHNARQLANALAVLACET